MSEPIFADNRRMKVGVRRLVCNLYDKAGVFSVQNKLGGGGGGGDYLVLLTSATFTEVYRSLKLCWKITIAIRTEILDAEIHSLGHSHCRHVALLGGSDGHNLCTWRS